MATKFSVLNKRTWNKLFVTEVKSNLLRKSLRLIGSCRIISVIFHHSQIDPETSSSVIEFNHYIYRRFALDFRNCE